MEYVAQLQQIDLALQACTDESERQELLNLRSDINELAELTNERVQNNSENNDPMEDEYALFMQEMQKEGALAAETINANAETKTTNIKVETQKNDETNAELAEKISELEGKKCSAPFKFEWGGVEYHNAMISSVENLHENISQIEVRVMFINPIHEKMLPCPYFLETDCKFSEERCKYSHGEKVPYVALKEFAEPNFADLAVGNRVLAKQPDKIWRRARIMHLGVDKCTVKFESNVKQIEVKLEDVVNLAKRVDESSDSDSSSDSETMKNEDIINMSLMNTVTNAAIGGWESHTKGIGSKLMQKMGYVIGTGLGKLSDGRIEPITTLILPKGKSLDYCMELKEKTGDNDIFSSERRQKRLKRHAKMSRDVYNKEKKKTDVFSFLNEKLLNAKQSLDVSRREHRQEVKKESSKELNVASLKIDESIKQFEKEMWKLNESLSRHTDKTTKVHRDLKKRLDCKRQELQELKDKAVNIKHEQQIRSDKRKLTVF